MRFAGVLFVLADSSVKIRSRRALWLRGQSWMTWGPKKAYYFRGTSPNSAWTFSRPAPRWPVFIA